MAPLIRVSTILDQNRYSENSFLRVQSNVFSLFWNIKTLKSYSDFEPAIFGWVVKTAFYVSGRNIFWKINNFMNFFWHWANNFRTLNEKFSAGLLKLHSTCPEKHFKKYYIFFERNYSFIIFFPNFEQKIFGHSAKVFRRDCQKWIFRVHRNILGFFRKRELNLNYDRK